MLTIGITINTAINTTIITAINTTIINAIITAIITIVIDTNTITSPRIKFGFLRIIHTDGIKQCFMMVTLQSSLPSISINHYHHYGLG